MYTVVVIGHKGMLGNAVVKYFSTVVHNVTVVTLTKRFGEHGFASEIIQARPDYIINCAGIIPQAKPDQELYSIVNIALPLFLDSLGVPVIHPSTDCEFSGTLPEGEVYTKDSIRDADDIYGSSKAYVSEILELRAKNTKIIRTSIIGHEEKSNKALLDWFLSQDSEAKGFVNHFWNGVTTLEWVKHAYMMMSDWEKYPKLTQLATLSNRSKYDLLCDIKEVYEKDIVVQSFSTESMVNKCLKSDKNLPSIKEQLVELRNFYQK